MSTVNEHINAIRQQEVVGRATNMSARNRTFDGVADDQSPALRVRFQRLSLFVGQLSVLGDRLAGIRQRATGEADAPTTGTRNAGSVQPGQPPALSALDDLLDALQNDIAAIDHQVCGLEQFV